MVEDTNQVMRGRPGRARRAMRHTLFAVLLMVVAALSTLAGFYVSIARTVPSLEFAGDRSSTGTTRIYDDSPLPVLIAELIGAENHSSLTADRIPQVMRDAIVAVEDERFYVHPGVDFLAILKAVWADIRNREIVQGGSTITQKLIKNAYVGDGLKLDRKLREATLAYQLEKRWSKEKILNEYLNVIYFGEGAYGVEAAARTYFGVPAADLTTDQAAFLAGLPEAPSAYSPHRDPDSALARRDLVLNKMYQQEYITSAQLQGALAAPLEVAEPRNGESGTMPYWVEMVREQLTARYGSSTVLGGGLRVYTSVDLDLQQEAESAITATLDEPEDPSAALVCIEVRTGKLLAMVGGVDFAASGFNLAIQARRQPGTAFEPFVLAAALKQGMSPETIYDSGPIVFKLSTGLWNVASPDEGRLDLLAATARSSDGVFARLVMDVGADEVAETARDMGILSATGSEPAPAIALGELPTGVSLLEMAMGYATLASGGERLSSSVIFDPSRAYFPIAIIRVTDSEGVLLDQNEVERVRVLEQGLTAIVTSSLELAIAAGNGSPADIGRPSAGKTGTTKGYVDAWFIGYTPELVTAVWVGYPDGEKDMTDVRGAPVTGGTLPARIWASFMSRALRDTSPTDFAPAAE